MVASRRRRSLTLAVASDHALVAAAVRSALADRGFTATTMDWHRTGAPPPAAPPEGCEMGLLLSDLDRPSRIRAAVGLIAETDLPWVVLTGAPRGPVWGAVLAAGARTMLPTAAGIDEVSTVLREVAGGGGMPDDEATPLRNVWQRLQAEQRSMAARMASLSDREREVLMMLAAGEKVADIAWLLDLGPATVRTHVASVRRKLNVPTQLAAVAAYRTWGSERSGVPPSGNPGETL